MKSRLSTEELTFKKSAPTERNDTLIFIGVDSELSDWLNVEFCEIFPADNLKLKYTDPKSDRVARHVKLNP